MYLTRSLSQMRKSVLLLFDIGILVVAYFISTLLCQLSLPKQETVYSVILLVFIYSFMLTSFNGYSSLWRYAQPTEFFICVLANISGGFIFFWRTMN